MEFFEVTETDRLLIKMALEVLEANYTDGSYHHTVGSALLCKNGSIYKGVNCDCIHGSCAEFIAMGTAISAGERDFDTIVAVHQLQKNYVISPCGNCRQMMHQYCPDIKVLVPDDNCNVVKVALKDLLPFAWKPVVFEE